MIEKIHNKLLTTGKCTIIGLGTFYLLPRRQGKVFGFGKDKPIKYSKRISFKPSVSVKDKLCK